jgi:hypothetical protein
VLNNRLAELNEIAEAERANQQLRINAENEIRQLELQIEAQRQAEIEAQRQAEIEAQRQAEMEAQRQAEMEAQRQAEMEAQRQEEIEAQRQEEIEAQRQAEMEAENARQAEMEAQRQANRARLLKLISDAREKQFKIERGIQEEAAKKLAQVGILESGEEKAIKKEINEPDKTNLDELNPINPNNKKIQIFQAFKKLSNSNHCDQIKNKAVELKLANNGSQQVECVLCLSNIYDSFYLDEKTANENQNIVCYFTGILQMFHVKCFKGLQNDICPLSRRKLGSEISPLYIFGIDDTNPSASRCYPYKNYGDFQRALSICSDSIRPSTSSSASSSSSSGSNPYRDEREQWQRMRLNVDQILASNALSSSQEEQDYQTALRNSLQPVRRPIVRVSASSGMNLGGSKRRKTSKLRKTKKRKPSNSKKKRKTFNSKKKIIRKSYKKRK